MGIPSYYKKLIDTIPTLVSKGYPDQSISWLFMDFNCLIYHCLHRQDTPIYPGDAQREEWEAQFLECIQTYCLKVIKEVKPTKGVFIAIDGVVPMAKMRQQRLRRFKSVWLTQHEEKQADSQQAGWDRNSITPGTLFMTKLRKQLENMISKHGKKTWKLSSSDEPGEGEHKIIQEWRSGRYDGNFAIYGLDADLIVLSMLGRETCSLSNRIWLFREEMEAGSIRYDSNGEEEFEWFSIHALRDWLCSDSNDPMIQRQFILNYCFAMSILGNDFLPTSMSLKIREDGHSELLDMLKQLSSNQISLVTSDHFSICLEGIVSMFRTLFQQEHDRITKYIRKKTKMSQRILSAADTPIEVGHHDWPMYHIEETRLMQSQSELSSNWQETYLTQFFPGFHNHPIDLDRICQDYLYGIQWIWGYYTGNMDNVCFDWYYPFSLPPLWEWIHAYLQRNTLPSFPNIVRIRASDIRPIEQLALVLPLASWSLLPVGPEKKLPYLAPHLFPESFGFDSIGKRYFWECESMIPIPSIHTLKEIIKQGC